MKANWKLIETAPKDGTQVMVCHKGNIEPAVWEAVGSDYVDEPYLDKYGEACNYVVRNGWVGNGLSSDEESRELKPTHWDYMPDLPTAEDNEIQKGVSLP